MQDGKHSCWFCWGDSAHALLREAQICYPSVFPKAEVFGPQDDLSEGTLQNWNDPAAREQMLRVRYADFDADTSDAFVRENERAATALDTADEIVLWTAQDCPAERCMMLSLINRLQGRDVPIWLVEVSEMPLTELREPEGTIGGATAIAVMMDDKIPWYWRLFRHPLTWWYLRKRKKLARQETRAGSTVRYGLVGEMEYRAAPYFWEKRRRLTDEERWRAAEQWAQLVREDALLRAVVNGEVRSVGEDFYDEIILSCVTKTEETAAVAIGSAMAKIDAEMCSRVGDLLIYRRLRALADAGRVALVCTEPQEAGGAPYWGVSVKRTC